MICEVGLFRAALSEGFLLICIILRALSRRVDGLLMSARCLLTLEMRGDLARRLARCSGWRSMGFAAVTTVARLTGFSLVVLERVVMAMAVGDRGVELTFRMTRRMTRMKNGRSDSLSAVRSVVWLRVWLRLWLRSVVPISGMRGRPAASSWR